MRVHELAKTLKVPSKELLERLRKEGIEAKSHMANLDEKAVAAITRVLKTPAPAVKKPAVPATPSVKASEPPQSAEKQKPVAAPAPSRTAVVEPIKIDAPISVGNLAIKINLKPGELIKTLMNLGVFANVNQMLNDEAVLKLCAQLGVAVSKIAEEEEPGSSERTAREKADHNAKSRPPVVTLMGHVDHGKTSLLDAIRKTNVAEKEAGRITQHIGAHGVDIPGKGHVTFLDTPGHEAFTAMRARGANVTDVVVLVVAADDGVMPQTIEAINHAREARVPIVVAVNKCDLPHVNPQKVMMQLQKLELVAEEWGGKTIFCKVSAKTGEGIEKLLEMLLLEAEVLELKSNPDTQAEGAVIEGRLTKGSGPVATVIIQKGTLRVGDIMVAGPHYGKVRMLQNDRKKTVQEAGPAYAVEVHGLNGVPDAGEKFQVFGDEKTARQAAEAKMTTLKEKKQRGGSRHLSLDDLHVRIQEGSVKEFKLIIKADVQGSAEALSQSLETLSTEAVRLHVIHGGVGAPTESDVMLAAASDAVIISFHVKPDSRAVQLCEEEGVDLRVYNIIYEAVEDVRKAMEGLLEPVYYEVSEGKAEVRQVFRSSKMGTIGGGSVFKGKITRSSKVRLIRNKQIIFEGKLGSLKRFKDDVREVAEGFEFGFGLEGSSDIKEGDTLEAFRLEKGSRTKA